MSISHMPVKLNHCPVIKSEAGQNVATVLVQGDNEYIVATWWPELGKTWSWGHYFPYTAENKDALYVEALSDFADTVKRNATR